MTLERISEMEIDAKVELIQELIPLGLMCVAEELKNEGERLAGPRHSRGQGLPGHVRWGRQNGSAVRSLEEGFEETLTLHRLGLFLEELEPAATVGCRRIAGHRTGADKDPRVSPSAVAASRSLGNHLFSRWRPTIGNDDSVEDFFGAHRRSRSKSTTLRKEYYHEN